MDLQTLDALRWSREKERCERDFLYLASTYLRIKSKDQIGFPTLKLNRVQQHLWDKMLAQWKRIGCIRQVWGKSRQVGASTLMRAFNFQQTAFNNNRNALLVTHDEPSSYEMFDIDRTFYDALPPQLRPRARNIAKSRIVFDGRNSKILVGHALNLNVAASQMNHIAHITEAARYRNAYDVQASLFPSISEARGEHPSIVVVESTSVYGGTWFKEFAEAAQRGETEYEFTFVPYFWHPSYQLPVPQDFEPTLEERDHMQRYGLTAENVVWYRSIKAKYRSRPALVRQEYPLCLVADTRVDTPDGIVPLGTLEARGTKEVSGRRLLAWTRQAESETYTATTSLGYRVTGTRDHRLLRFDDTLVALGDSVGCLLRLQPPQFSRSACTISWAPLPSMQSSIVMSPDAGLFLGYFAGDGSYYGRGSQVDLAGDGRDDDVLAALTALVQRLFGVVPRRRQYGAPPGGFSLRWQGKEMFSWLHALGVVSLQQTDALRWRRRVCVPDAMWQSSQDIVAAFLSGLFEADGHVSLTGRVLLFSKHEAFLRDVQVLLLGFGITSRLGIWSKGQAKEGRVLCLRGTESAAFRERIGFMGTRKRARCHPTQQVGRRQPAPIILADHVVLVEPAGVAATYDIALPSPHIFSANGIAVHNSWESSWQMPEGTLRVFDDDLLDQLGRGVRPPLFRAHPSSTGLQRSLGGFIEVWHEPQPDNFYDMGVDVAGGGSERADWSVASVIRRDTLEQVAQLRVNMNPATSDFIDLIYWLGMNYNAAQINPDITGGWGNALLTDLQSRSYPAIWQWRRGDDVKGRISSRLGFWYTRRDKANLVHNAVTLATRGDVTIHSETLLDEMRAFLNIGLDEWAAAHGAKDDAVNAWMLALLSARSDRIIAPADTVSAAPAQTKAQAKPWSVQDVDTDLQPTAQRSFGWLRPWRG